MFPACGSVGSRLGRTATQVSLPESAYMLTWSVQGLPREYGTGQPSKLPMIVSNVVLTKGAHWRLKYVCGIEKELLAFAGIPDKGKPISDE